MVGSIIPKPSPPAKVEAPEAVTVTIGPVASTDHKPPLLPSRQSIVAPVEEDGHKDKYDHEGLHSPVAVE